MDIPPRQVDKSITLNDLALLDEISGLNNFLEGFLKMNDLPETVKDRIRARMFKYESDVPKEIALNEIREVLLECDTCDTDVRKKDMDFAPSTFIMCVYKMLTMKLTEGGPLLQTGMIGMKLLQTWIISSQ